MSLKKRKKRRYRARVPVHHVKNGFELVVRAKPDAAEIGGALRRLRVEAGISLSDMAERVGIAHQNLSRIELGKKEPMVSTLNKYLRTLGLELMLTARPKAAKKGGAPALNAPGGKDDESES